MPKSTVKASQRTRERIINSSMNLLLSKGYESVTFANIAKGAGVSRSGINAHFKHKADLEEELSSALCKIICGKLDFSCCASFKSTWSQGLLSDPEFINAVFGAFPILYRVESIEKIADKIESGTEKEKLAVVYWCTGHSIMQKKKSHSLEMK